MQCYIARGRNVTERLYPKRINGRLYYYLQRSWREKLDPDQHGSTKGSGKSRVKTESIYLGTAESIVQRLQQLRKPLEVHSREFGFVGAAYTTMLDIGLIELLKTHLPGTRHGIPLWVFFTLSIINRLQYATSKESMGKWATKTILPQLLRFDPQKVHSKSFWYATDEVLSEQEVRERRRRQPHLKDALLVGIEDECLRRIEEGLFVSLQQRFSLGTEVLLYDTTNFFTYFEEPTRAKVARSGHNKSSRHHLKQVGLALCVEKDWGIPLLHRLYRGNSHDTNTFSEVVPPMIEQLKRGFEQIAELVVVLDKGNNSAENFALLKDQMRWVGSLVPSQYADLLEVPLDQYPGTWQGLRYYRSQRTVMGHECAVVLTYNAKLHRKQELKLQQELEKLRQKVRAKWAEYKRRPTQVPAGIGTLLKASRYGKYLELRCAEGQPVFELNTTEMDERTKRFGKNLVFTGELAAESSWILAQYLAKHRIEEDFKLLKDPQLIRWQPMRHWTDTKVWAFGFCCVMALVLIRLMQLKAYRAGMKMSAAVLKEELTDLKQISMVYEENAVETKITARSSVQQHLWEIFKLDRLEADLTRH